ncbi:hypothetical protein ACN47E_000787 [Coniothyrium glycines]
MANVARPVLRQTTLTFAPLAPPDDAHSDNIAVSTRRPSASPPGLLLAHPLVQQTHHTPLRPAPPARTSSSRKRPAAELDPDATDTSPPAKVTVTQPHGELRRTANGLAVPLAVAAPQDKRSLRSHDGGSRLKSDLAVYFANYDDVIAGLPKPAEFLEAHTPIHLVDEPSRSKPPTTPAPTEHTTRASVSPARSRRPRPPTPPRHGPSSTPASQSSIAHQVLDYTTITKAVHHVDGEDPLSDSLYFPAHRRAERKEKQLRNIEKERAMHEKVQLERLLDGLQGPDWLKVMGITGVTDGEKKDWEAKRDYFVKEVEALVDKFRQWKEEEKRLRAEKEAALAAQDESSDAEEEDEDEDEDEDKAAAYPHPPPKHHTNPSPPKPRRPPRPHGFLLPFIPPESLHPFESFYSKPHLRAAALGKHRHGRNASAFGLPVPDFEEAEFELPEDFIDPQYLRDNARQRRRRKRESTAGGTKGPTES